MTVSDGCHSDDGGLTEGCWGVCPVGVLCSPFSTVDEKFH